jgi:hypothetical protein
MGQRDAMKLRVRLTPEEAAELVRRPPRQRLSADFNIIEHHAFMQAQRDRYRLPNIPEVRECKYIFGEVYSGEAYYCGKPTVEGASWCKRHKKVCTRKLSRSDDVYRMRKHGKWY